LTSCREAAYFKADEKDKYAWAAVKKFAHSFTARARSFFKPQLSVIGRRKCCLDC